MQAELMSHYTDNFDTASFPNFECQEHPAFIQYTRLGPDLSVSHPLFHTEI